MWASIGYLLSLFKFKVMLYGLCGFCLFVMFVFFEMEPWGRDGVIDLFMWLML